jgi:heme-degrading monooxygenase HmoA
MGSCGTRPEDGSPGRAQEQPHRSDSLDAYSPAGEWARLFRRANGHLGTELLRRSDNQGEYLTLDRWTSRPSYEAFRSRWSDEYGRLDRRLEGLTEEEAPLGYFEMLP